MRGVAKLRWTLGVVVLALGFLASCGSDKLEACASCSCNCGDGRTITTTSDPPPCDCASACRAQCGRTPASAVCSKKVEVDSCAVGAVAEAEAPPRSAPPGMSTR